MQAIDYKEDRFKKPLIKGLRERTASLLFARKLAYSYDRSRFLRDQLHHWALIFILLADLIRDSLLVSNLKIWIGRCFASTMIVFH